MYYNSSQKSDAENSTKNTEFRNSKKELTLKKVKLITAHIPQK